MSETGHPGHYEVAVRCPLVVLAVAGAPHQLELLAKRLADDFPTERFVGILCAADDDGFATTLSILRAELEEVIFTDSSAPEGLLGADLAMRALEEYQMGQDFVFTVADLGEAITYAIDVLTDEKRSDWEGTAILVLGSRSDLTAARRAVSASGGNAPP
ncbi:hypothetical protein [Occultella kanbiaonis]|uniref:hypothetical protein n=1 Tax=Occultella kanbiaonis TaxID=2675754 RepID=UPI0012B86EB5|nr:hypothetical protein [Occultella kanbiaonis]